MDEVQVRAQALGMALQWAAQVRRNSESEWATPSAVVAAAEEFERFLFAGGAASQARA